MDRINKLKTFLEQEPNDPFLKYALATEYLASNNFQDALSLFENLILDHPDYIGTYYHLAKLYLKLNHKTQAIDIFEKGIMVAKSQKKQHALSELQNAYNELLFDE